MSPPSDVGVTVWAELRHAEPSDVPFLQRMIHQMAEFEGNPHYCSATESSLLSTLFPSPPLPPFLSPTPLLLYLSATPPPQPSPQTFSTTKFSLPSPVTDPERDRFASPLGDGRTIAGFLFCFPNYSTPIAKPGLYIEDIFIREPWRRNGLGKFMLSAVAKKAAEMGMGRVEWCVLNWNVNAIEFYKGMGARVLPEWRICCLSGSNLDSYKDE